MNEYMIKAHLLACTALFAAISFGAETQQDKDKKEQKAYCVFNDSGFYIGSIEDGIFVPRPLSHSEREVVFKRGDPIREKLFAPEERLAWQITPKELAALRLLLTGKAHQGHVKEKQKEASK